MGYGISSRSKPTVQVLKGYDPMNNTGLSQTAPVASGVTILSGQAIALTWNGPTSRYEWTLQTLVGSRSTSTFIAMQDSTSYGISESGLTGISTSGDYEIQTSFFAAGTYNVDTKVIISSTTPGSFAVAPAAGGGTTEYPVLGKVTRIRGSQLLQNAATGVHDDSSTSAANSGYIIFATGSFPSVLAA